MNRMDADKIFRKAKRINRIITNPVFAFFYRKRISLLNSELLQLLSESSQIYLQVGQIEKYIKVNLMRHEALERMNQDGSSLLFGMGTKLMECDYHSEAIYYFQLALDEAIKKSSVELMAIYNSLVNLHARLNQPNQIIKISRHMLLHGQYLFDQSDVQYIYAVLSQVYFDSGIYYQSIITYEIQIRYLLETDRIEYLNYCLFRYFLSYLMVHAEIGAQEKWKEFNPDLPLMKLLGTIIFALQSSNVEDPESKIIFQTSIEEIRKMDFFLEDDMDIIKCIARIYFREASNLC